MRVLLMRLGTRRLMALVALVALPLGAVRLMEWRAFYFRLAADHARWEEIHARTGRGWEERLEYLRGTVQDGDEAGLKQIADARQTIRDASTMTAIFAERRRIAERLASHPWESVPPDPLDKKPEDPGPAFLFESGSGVAYEFSTGSVALLTVAPVVGLLAYVAYRVSRARRFATSSG